MASYRLLKIEELASRELVPLKGLCTATALVTETLQRVDRPENPFIWHLRKLAPDRPLPPS